MDTKGKSQFENLELLFTRGSFLLAITVAGCLTISFGGMGYFLLPSVKGSKPPTKNYAGLAVTRCEKKDPQIYGTNLN